MTVLTGIFPGSFTQNYCLLYERMCVCVSVYASVHVQLCTYFISCKAYEKVLHKGHDVITIYLLG